MNKHTPGPWGRIVELGCDVYAISKDPESHTFVAECAIEEDARFIAAAPAMYEAVKDAIDTIAHMRHYYAGRKLSEEDIQKIVDTSRTALAQAEGSAK